MAVKMVVHDVQMQLFRNSQLFSRQDFPCEDKDLLLGGSTDTQLKSFRFSLSGN